MRPHLPAIFPGTRLVVTRTVPSAPKSLQPNHKRDPSVPRRRLDPRSAVRESWLAYMVLGVGLLITALLTGIFLRGVQERQALRAQKQALEIQNRFQTRMARNMTALVGAAGLFGIDARLTPAEFRNFATSLQRFGALDGVLAFGFSPRVTALELQRYLNTIQRRVPRFSLWPEYIRDDYFPIEHLEPSTALNQMVVGFDMYQHPVRREAMEFARKHGEPAASGRLSLLQDAETRYGFTVYVPIYQRGIHPSSPAEREAKLVGFIHAAYRADDLVALVLSPTERANFAVQLMTGSKHATELLYGAELPSGSSLISSRSLGVGGRDITLSLYHKPHAASLWSAELALSVVLGVLVSFLLFLALHNQVRARLKALTYAARLREARQTAVRNLRARETFLSVASHELKTPLTALQLQVDALAMSLVGVEPMNPDRLRERAANIGRQIQRLSSLVEDLLDVSQVSASPLPLNLENTKLAPLIRNVLADFSAAANQAQSELQFKTSDEELAGFWDRRRLQKVVATLLSNAIKYGSGQPVTVSVEPRGLNVNISIADRGIGIDQADQKRIFGRFERAVSPKHFGGMGLGLWIARAIVESMGGAISVVSAKGAGATFVVSLPMYAADAENTNDAIGAA